MSHHELLPIPPAETATDPVYSAADLCQRWRALMGPLGFGERMLWFSFVGPDRCLTKVLSHLPIGLRPQAQTLKNLMSALRTLLDDMAAGSTVALLLTGPGRGAISSDELLWLTELTTTAAQFDVPLEPIFRANDDSLVPVDQ